MTDNAENMGQILPAAYSSGSCRVDEASSGDFSSATPSVQQVGSIEPRAKTIIERGIQRFLEIIISFAALVLLSPLMLLIGILIRLDSPGPAFFRHERIGLDRRSQANRVDSAETIPPSAGWQHAERRHINRYGKPFRLFKFRTMFADARERFPELYRYEYTRDELHSVPIKVLVGSDRQSETEGLDETFGADPRLTRVGRWLRRVSLDELPNFISVLVKDLALVGARPDISENIRHYPEHHLVKLKVMPGVTGLAQVEGRGTLSMMATNELDLRYIAQQSLWLDLKILCKTIWVTIKRDGAF
jgi:lipopolysaccharide/colanic/teichoic acid biosynthesis glycosyltransferase